MKVLVLVAGYATPDGGKSMFFVHTRSLRYVAAGIETVVLSFSAKTDYVIDGIEVISYKSFKEYDKNFDILILHAPNLRNHFRFLVRYGNIFKKKVFIFHGHEILHVSKYYPKPYDFIKTSKIKKIGRNIYDNIKLRIWNRYFTSHINEQKLIFVSHWLFEQFVKEVRIDEKLLEGHYCIINNSIGSFFEENTYVPFKIDYDFITIRSALDRSEYCIDLLTETANRYPSYRFCLIGSGEFFDHYEKPKNITWIKGVLNHDLLAESINHSKFALMLIREDTQGVMSCELATYGIPLITSNIPVTHEIFSECNSVAFVSNDKPDLEKAIEELSDKHVFKKFDKYYASNTVEKEIAFLNAYFEE